MAVITFKGYRPPPRYDALAYTDARIEEGPAAIGPWTILETIALTPVDADPENPVSRDLTTELADDAADLWYRIVFLDATADESQPTDAVQNTAPDVAYASVSELARILKIRAPTDEQTNAMERVLSSAALEIDAELGRTEALAGWQLALVAEVNMERAVEHWQQQEAAFGLIGIGGEFGATHTATDSWNRHAHKLAPLKESWGLA